MKELLDTGVRFDLTYYEKEDALIGCVKGYSAAVRENLSTGSYGVLMWVKRGVGGETTAEEYLNGQRDKDPAFIKNFRVTDLGVAIALNRKGDAYSNITALKRFLYELADFFSKNSYVNCCCKCAAVDGLGVYSAENLITQTCEACGAEYHLLFPLSEAKTPIKEKFPIPALAPAGEPEKESVPEAIAAPAESAPEPEKAAPAPAAENDISDYLEQIRERNKNFNEELAADAAAQKSGGAELDDLFAPPVEEPGEPTEFDALFAAPVEEPAEKTEFDHFFTPAEQEEKPDNTEAKKEFDEFFAPKKPDEPEEKTEFDEFFTPAKEEPVEPTEFDELLAPEKAEKEEKKHAPGVMEFVRASAKADPDGFGFAEAVVEKPAAVAASPAVNKSADQSAEAAFDSLMFSEEPEEPAPPKSELFEQIEREYAAEQAMMRSEDDEEDDGIDDLLYDSIMDEPEEETRDVIREEKHEPVPDVGTSELLINEGGEIEIKSAEKEIDDGTVVTEIRDDSNDGEDVDVSELKTSVFDPTVTTDGEQLTAEETPLEVDGSVPLVNPNMKKEAEDYSIDGPDAVTALEEQINKYTHQVPEPSFSKGFASSDHMIDRDAPVVYSDQKKKGSRKAPPPKYSTEKEREALSRKSPGYESEFNYHEVSHISSRLIPGIIGAILFGILGLAVWGVVAFFVNRVGWLGAFAMVPAIYVGYYLLGRALDKKGIVMSMIFSLLLASVGAFIVTIFSVNPDIINTVISSEDIMGAAMDELQYVFGFVVSDKVTKDGLIMNLIFSYIITIASTAVATGILWKRTLR